MERVKIENSLTARGAEAARSVALSRLSAGVAVGRLLADVPLDSRFDLSATSAEAGRLELCHLAADPADLLCRRRSVEETQPRVEHYPSSSGEG